MSKPRPDDKLNDFRDELFPRMRSGASYHSLARWLEKEHGVRTSNAALSNAWTKWSREDLEERVLKSKTGADDVMELIDNPEQLDAAIELGLKQATFEMVMSGADPKSVKSFCTILLQSEKLKHEQASLDLKLRQYEDQISEAQKATANAEKGGGLTPEALREIKNALRM